MIKEDYVSFETAKLLKERGFNEECEYFYDYYDNEYFICSNGVSAYNDDEHPTYYSMPTLQMAIKWLREVHNLFIEMHIQNGGNYIGYIYNTNGFGLIGWDKRRVSSSYEKACEAAIKYCLENLI